MAKQSKGYWGIPYQGSKNAIAEQIHAYLPSGKRFVDLFGGGFAMSHYAVASGKYESVYYNDIEPTLAPLIQDAIHGKYSVENFTPEFITREMFNEHKDTDGYVKWIWSFGNDGQAYMFGRDIEPWKKAYHQAVVFDDYSLFEDMEINAPKFEGNYKQKRLKFRQWIIDNNDDCVAKYKAYFSRLIDCEKALYNCKDIDSEYKAECEKLRQYLRNARKKDGIRASECNKHTQTQMATHWFSASQWAFPTKEYYGKLQEIMPSLDISYEHISKRYNDLRHLQQLEQLEQLEHLQQLERLERLEQLERLERLERKITFHCGDYRDYEYQDGDVVYCDIPYWTPTSKGDYGCDFNWGEFFMWAMTRPYPVYFSHYTLGAKLWNADKRNLYPPTKNDLISEECLYVVDRNYRHGAMNKQATIFDAGGGLNA